MREVVYLGNVPAVAVAIRQTAGYVLKAVLIESEDDRDLFKEIELSNIPIYRIPNKTVLSAALESFSPFDIGVIANFGLILSTEDISCADLGFVNAHPGLLPHNKGRHPIQQSILEKHSETGICLHRVTPIVDGGEILSEHRITIDECDDYDSLCSKLYFHAPQLIQQHLLSLQI